MEVAGLFSIFFGIYPIIPEFFPKINADRSFLHNNKIFSFFDEVITCWTM